MNTPAATTRRSVFAYLRLSREEALHGESNSITTQRQMISDFCQQKGFILINVFADDGWSGGNKDALRRKRENGQYCACPPYGYRKADRDKSRLVPDEATAPVVRRIFERAAAGDSSRKIALDLNADGIIPPLKYRALYRDEFSDKGAARASDIWNYTTVKRILKNPVYLGHTLLGKSKKVSVKSKKKIPIPKEEWTVTKDTHEPLVSESIYQKAQVADLETESASLNDLIQALQIPHQSASTEEKYARFFSLARQYTYIDTLDRDTLITFVD